MMYLAASVVNGLAFISAFFAGFIWLLRKKSKRIFGIYPKKGLLYYIKYPLALQFLRYWRQKIFYSHADQLNSSEYLQFLDRPHTLSSNPKSYDIVSFVGANREGYKFMMTIERRRRGIIKAAFYLWTPNFGLLSSPNLPDMVHFTTDGEKESEGFEAENFKIYPVECMRKWKIIYNGDIKRGSNNFPFKFQGEFTSEMDHFDYNKDLSSSIIADSVAREAWDDEFFHMVKNVDEILETRTHYEQCGKLNGTFHLGDNSEIQLDLYSFRDHSFGTERCLSSINRYVHFALFLDDDTNLVVGILSQPSFFLSSLKVGYICIPNKLYIPINSCNFELYSYGEKGVPPNHQNFIVETETCKYFVQIKSEECALRYVGGDWESKVYSQFVSCTVNGVKGHGIVEYLYRNKTGRPDLVSKNDPEWYRKIRSFERSLSNGEFVDEWSDSDVFF